MTTAQMLATLLRIKRILITNTVPISTVVQDIDRIVDLIKSRAADFDAVLYEETEVK